MKSIGLPVFRSGCRAEPEAATGFPPHRFGAVLSSRGEMSLIKVRGDA